MIYITNNQSNTIFLNINNNSRTVFTGYSFNFTHILSQDTSSLSIDITDDLKYTGNTRYCAVTFIANFIYEGEYSLEIRGNNTELVWSGIVILGEVIPTDTFNELISDNENNENYIYIE